MCSPDLLPLRVTPDDTIHHWGLARLRVCVVAPNGIDLDILRIINVYELLVDVGAVRSGEVEVRIQFARLIPDLFKS